jgi:UDP-N-acetylmuramoylalanine--D-glutamate ligase
MEEVVSQAQLFASDGDTVLLAPACASMDQFISYADRGDRFAEAIRKALT